MVLNILGWLIFLALTILFGWLVTRSWKANNALFKWSGVSLAGLLTLILALVTIVIGRGLYSLYAPRNTPIPEITVAGTPEQIARGEHIAQFICVDCHSTNGQLPLSGGRDVGKDSPVPIGAIVSVNLTPGGPLKDWLDGEIFRALREGVDRQGRPLIAMSAMSTRNLSDEDMQAVIAFLRSQPAVENDTPSGDSPNLLLAVFAGANLIPAPPPVTGKVVAPSKGPTAEYGQYIVTFIGCSGCHGRDLSGGAPGGLAPVGPNLRVVSGWTQEQFVTALRTGVDPSGHKLDVKQMPWRSYAHMDDQELTAVYLYLKSLPPTGI